MEDYSAHHSPDLARGLYTSLRKTSVTKRLAKLRSERKQIEIRLASHRPTQGANLVPEVAQMDFARLVEHQTRYGNVTVAIGQLESLLGTGETAQSSDEINAEFDEILATPGVVAVDSAFNTLRIVVCGQVEYNGHLYDTGDWELSLPTYIDGFESRVLRRTNLVKGWPLGKYPSYYHEGGFCFGSSRATIEEYSEAGQILPAVQLAVYCICSVSLTDLYHIPNALKRLD